MSWRTTQLGDKSCDQDYLILDLFKGQTVNYVGSDFEFCRRLSHDTASTNLVLILNHPLWISDIVAACQKYLSSKVKTFYLGVNRYQVLGNDTYRNIKRADNHSSELIQLITDLAQEQGFNVLKSGQHDQDLGRYFNFVQPLTWVYGHNNSNQSH
jgi:hypothetical protein